MNGQKITNGGKTMSLGKLIVFEGIDGSGKATQAGLLADSLRDQGENVMEISFPDYKSPASMLVRMYLDGRFGSDPDSVNPYTASLFYAVDRFASFRIKWESFYLSGGIVIADRYTTSNMVHQMTKYDDPGERSQFLSWLEDTEYDKMGLPRPDAVFLLDVPLSVSLQLVRARNAGGRPSDIHEKDPKYMSRCYEAYDRLSRRYGWIRIACTQPEGMLKSEKEIADDVLTHVCGLLKDRKG